MKKILMAVFALVVAATVASAGVAINWNTYYGAYTHDAPDLTEYPTSHLLLDSYSAIWQLIYAGVDNTIDPIPSHEVPVAGGANGDYVYGDDIVWGQREINVGGGAAGDGTSWNNEMLLTGGYPNHDDAAWVTDGFVYQRVFETQVFGTVSVGDYYYESGLLELNTGWVPGNSAQSFYLDTPSAGFQASTPIYTIPEPATMSLLGLGALAMVLRRRRS
jgi:hypothetical protein